jgi:cysteine peptidase C11 family protein
VKVSGSGKSDWTVLCYLDAHGGLQGGVDRSMRQLESVGSTDSVQLVAQVANEVPYSENYTSHIQKSKLFGLLPNSRSTQGPSKPDPSSPQALTESIVNTTKAFPSKSLMVVLGGHGGAFKGLLPNTSTGKKMELQGLKSALDAAVAVTGRPIDMLVLDSCLMGSAETAYAVKDSVKYLAASEEVLLDGNLRFDKLAKELPGRNPEQAADAVMKARNNRMLSTSSVIDCSKMDELVKRMRPFSGSVNVVDFDKAQHFRQPSVLKRLSTSDGSPSELSDMRDLASLARESGQEELAKFVRDEVVVRHAHGKRQGLEDSHGLSVYAPTADPNPEYQNDPFSQATGWLALMADDR